MAVLVGLSIFAARTLVVFAFGSSTPFWDQWGAEATMLYRPMLLDQFDPSVLWTDHNEHRIGLTRLVAMALFQLNESQWDCRIAALFNVAIYVSGAVLLVGLVVRNTPSRVALALSVVIALVGILPCGWENTVSSFQTGFHLLFVLTILLVWCVASRPPSWTTALAVAVLVSLLHFTIASNLLVLAAAIGVVGMRAATGDLSVRSMILLAIPLVLGLVLGLATIPPAPNPFRVVSTKEFFDAWMLLANWPGPFPAVVLFAVPCVLALIHMILRRDYRPLDGFFAAIFGIGVLTCMATALNRGHGLHTVTPRYADMLALAGMAPIYFSLTALQRASVWQRRGLGLLGFAAASMFLIGMAAYSLQQWPQMQQRRGMLVAGTGHARAYLDGDRAALDGKHQLYALYPLPGHLPIILDDPLTRALLPLSLYIAGPRLSQQVLTACAWVASGRDTGGRPRGRIECDGREAAGRIRVGRLSAIGYRLWQALDLHALPELKPTSRAANVSAAETCSIDMFNLEWVPPDKRIRLNYVPAIRLIGWSIHKGAAPDLPLELALVSASNVYSLRTTANAVRPELEMFHKDPAHVRGGFDFDIDAAAVAPGDYRILLRRGEAPFCDSHTQLSIARATDERMLY
ncbi:MAG: hypothetical protein JNN30_01915 [Rhodanobacteraceae bacterium]|nr:hypothetical protein [Rhodanobacteraceae bacterium]